MRVAIISIGRELLRGRVLDSNSNFIARQLTGMNHRVVRISQVDDIADDIIWEIHFVLSLPVDAIITTGGLGPTSDDITVRSIAAAFEVPCKMNKEALEIVKERYKIFYELKAVDSPDLTPERAKMACLPLGAEPIYNRVGAAPGMKWHRNGTLIFSLPGVPSEMKDIFEYGVKPYFVTDMSYVEKFFTTPCRDESQLTSYIKNFLKKYPDLYLKSVPVKFGKDVKIEVVIGVSGEKTIVYKRIENYIKEFLDSIRGPC